MSVKNLSEQLILVTLPPGREIIDELKSVNEAVWSREDCDVVIDFSYVEMVTTVCINNLIVLLNLLHERGHRLILCSVAVQTKCIFTVAGLDGIFEFADDRDAAVEAIQQTN